ncbi:hypothetical protein BHM03_00015810 [Ensete ventricosum]|nr:hypothetical protein BHM03_00015810 [Ensete ventricosum]
MYKFDKLCYLILTWYPINCVFAGARTFKIIDLGAAADLRVGINYIPKEFLLDPRYLQYAAPEQYIMSTQTPSAPSAPVATALSPVLWQLNLPDRFDIYSVGLIFLQMNELQFNLQEREPKRGNPQRNVLASILRVQRKIIRTLNESMDELNRSRKSLWWSRWIPREE